MTITDQIGNTLSIDQTPQRIISLVPSQTELLVDLGLVDAILGVTKFCVHPERLRKEKVIVGGTKTVNYSKIKNLNPDIILCNKEENTKEMVERLQEIAPVHVSDIKTLDEATALIHQYGELFKKGEEAAAIVDLIEKEKSIFRESIMQNLSHKKVGYFIWKEPLMVAGSNTFIHVLLEELGFENVFAGRDGRYPEVAWSDLKDLDYIFLSSEPFPFKDEHLEEFQKVTSAKIVLVDGEYFSWYGSRLMKAFSYFKALRSELKL